jgi:hypothetical protein
MSGRTPKVAALQTQPPSPRATIMLGALYRCWRYKPSERASAKEIRAIVSLLTRGSHSGEIANVTYRWDRLGRFESQTYAYVGSI